MDDRNELLLNIAKAFGAEFPEGTVIDDRNEILLEIAKALGAEVEEDAVVDNRTEILKMIGEAADDYAEGKITPTGDYDIFYNGEYDVAEYATATVAVVTQQTITGTLAAPGFDETLYDAIAAHDTTAYVTINDTYSGFLKTGNNTFTVSGATLGSTALEAAFEFAWTNEGVLTKAYVANISAGAVTSITDLSSEAASVEVSVDVTIHPLGSPEENA